MTRRRRGRIEALGVAVVALMGCGAPIIEPTSSSFTTPNRATPTHIATPMPTPSGVAVPASIDATGATDVAAELNRFVEGVPDGSRIVFPAGSTYLLSQGIQIADRTGLTFEGNGATLQVAPGASGADQLSSLFVLGHRYDGFWDGGNRKITIHGFALVGNNPHPAVFVAGTEGQNGVEVEDSHDVLLYDLTIRAVWGDGVKIGWASDGVTFRDSAVTSAGRNGVTVTSGRNITVERVAFGTSGYCVFDVEPNYESEVATHITFRNNTAETWGNAFLAVEGSHTGATIDGITVTGNTVTGGSLRTIVDNGGAARMKGITFSNNTSAIAVRGPVLRFAHVDRLTIVGNVQPLTSGRLTAIIDATGVTSD
jgi:hypothetical protein